MQLGNWNKGLAIWKINLVPNKIKEEGKRGKV
jgi:hypothetical protein